MNARVAAAELLLESFGWEVSHSRHVRDLAVSLFDQLQSVHGLQPDLRDLLDSAALLHDIGWTVAGAKHHKISGQLIRDHRARLAGFAPSEVELIANIARYHRKSLPALRHAPFAALTEVERCVVVQLAATLRIADGLDRPHRQLVREVTCATTDHHAQVRIKAMGDPDAHLIGARRKSDLFLIAFGRTIEFSVL